MFKKILILLLIFLCAKESYAQAPPGSPSVNAYQGGTWSFSGSGGLTVSQGAASTGTSANSWWVQPLEPFNVFATQSGLWNVGGLIAVSNFPASQAVTGTFFQTTQPVSIANPVAVTGTFFQTTQPVSGTITATQGTGSNLHVDVDSAPSTAVTGTVAISNFPTSQAVTGTFFQTTQPVSGTFFQATQPVSVATPYQVAASAEASTIYDGTTELTPTWTNLTASSSGATTLVAAVTGKTIYVVACAMTSNGTVNVKWQSHVTPTDESGLFYEIANTGYVLPFNPTGWFHTKSGEALDINLSASVAVGGSLETIAY